MAAPQTAVDDAPDIGVPGQLADLQDMADGTTYSKNSEESSAGIPFGVMCAAGIADDGALLPASDSDRLIGVSVFSNEFNRISELDTDGLQPGCTFATLWRGAIVVRVEDAVTPATAAHVRCGGTGQKGQFCAADGANSIDVSGFCRYLTSAGAGELAVVYVDMGNGGLAVSDS